MKSLLKILTILLVFMVIEIKFGICQEQDIKFDRFEVEDGLTSINSIILDKQGFMWFGGTHGLYRFDGYDFKIFTHTPGDSTSMCGNNVITIYPDKHEYLWIGTMNAGICRYNPEKEIFSSVKILENSSVTSIHRDHKGILWIGTSGEGLFVFDAQNNFIKKYENKSTDSTTVSNNEIFDIYEDNIGRIWVATNSGALDLYNRNNQNFSRFYFNPGGYKAVRTGQKIFRDHQGYFWIGTEGDGLYRFDEKDKTFKHYYHNHEDENSISNNIITGIAEGVHGEIWITTDGGGLNLLNTRSRSFRHFKHNPYDNKSLVNNSSYSLYIDKNQTLWLGMGDGVVNISRKNIFNIYQPSMFNEKNSLSFSVVVALCLTRNNHLWIGTGGGGLDVFDLNTRTFNNYRHDPTNPNSLSTDIILALHENSDGNIWVGTFLGGADFIDPEKKEVLHFKHSSSDSNSLINDHIFDIEEDVYGNVWLATQGGGLDKYNPQTGVFTHYQHNPESPGSLGSNRVLCLFEDRRNNLWIGTHDRGLQRFDGQNETFINYGSDKQTGEILKNNPIHDICEDSNGMLWFGSGEGGLCKMDPKTGEFSTLTIKEGLPSNSVYGVFEDQDKNIWFCTNKGISRYHPETKKIITLNSEDGLPTNDFEAGAIVQTAKGELFFGSKKGLISFYFNEIEQNIEDVKVLLTGFRIFNETIAAGQKVGTKVPLEKVIAYTDEIELPYHLNNFSFEFAAPGSNNPAKIKYRYQLEGADNRWIETDSKRRDATFSNLSPGDYIFKIIGANSAGMWSSNETQVKITITPPYWQTIWAYLIYIVLLAAITYFIAKEYTKRIRLRNQLNIEKYKHEKDNELNLLKIEFFTNVSHELRTPLTLILGPLERLINNYQSDNRIRHQMMVMQRNGQRLLHLVNHLLDFRKIESGKMQLCIQEADIVAFIKEIILSFQELALQKQICFKVESEAVSIVTFFDKSKLEIMIFNLLSNAFKFTPEKGEITLQIELIIENDERKWISIKVIDTGKGIDPAELPNIFELFYQENGNFDTKGTGIGLTLTKNLVELHHGSIHAESKYGEGSCFSIKLPASRLAFKDQELITHPKEDESTGLPPEKIRTPVAVGKKNEKLPIMLVVEDNAELNDFISESFAQQFDVLKAYNGVEGFEMASQNIPDIIISDVMMSQMDGVELCRNLKQDPRTSHIPVILLTARSADIYQLEGLKNGADDYITKPFNFDLLSARVVNLIESRQKLRERFQRELILRPKEFAINNPDERFLEKLMKLLEDYMSDPELSVAFLAREVGMSHSVLYRKILALTGYTVNNFIRLFRLQKASQILNNSDYTINEISDITGFSNSKYFSTCFKKEFSVTPTEFKQNHG